MIINRLLFIGFLFLTLTVSCNQKFYKTDKTFLEEGELIMKDFFLAFGDTISSERVRLGFNNPMGEQPVFQKKELLLHKTKTDHYRIRPFGRLKKTDIVLLENVISIGKLQETPKSLYYKLGTLWLLPQARAWNLGIDLSDILDENGQLDYWIAEKRMNKATLYFLGESGRLEAFPEFEKILKIIKSEMERDVGVEWFENMKELKGQYRNFKEYLYFRAGTMLITIEELD